MKYWRIVDGSRGVKQRWFLRDPMTAAGIKLDARLFTEGNKWSGQIEYPVKPGAVNMLKEGIDYGPENPLRIQIFQGHNPLTFTLGAFEVPVVENRIAEQLEACCDGDIQLIPAVIEGNDERYEIVNVLKILDAVDDIHSEIQWRTKADPYGREGKPYVGIGRLVLKKEIIVDCPIFRIKNWKIALVVSNSVKELLEELKTTGIAFTELSVR